MADSQGKGGARALSDDAQYARLIAQLDRTSHEPLAWRDVCDALANLVNATGGALFPFDEDNRGWVIPHSASLSHALQQYFVGGWYRGHLRPEHLSVAISRGSISDENFISKQDMARHPFYTEYLASCGLMWFAGITLNVTGHYWCATVHGPSDRGPFSPTDIDLLARARADLIAAAERAATLGHGRLRSLDHVYGACGQGAVLLKPSGKISWHNTQATQLLGDAGITIDDRLVSDDALLDAKLQRLARFMARFRCWPETVTPPPILVSAPGGRTLCIDMIPFASDFQMLLHGASMLVTVREVSKVPRLQDEARERFKLTKREVELLSHLLAGLSVAETSAKMNITVHTVRQHLKSVFAKTGTRRQSELVSLFLSA